MLFKCVLFCCVLVKCYAAFEGDQCTINDQTGTCTIIRKCLTAAEDLRHKKQPKICGFSGFDPIVCCLDKEGLADSSPTQPLAATIGRTLADGPGNENYVEIDEIPSGCAAISADLTTSRTGQRAFDKCLEYQEQFVYSCDKGVTLTEDMHRANHCYHDVEELFSSGPVAKNEIPHLATLGYANSDDTDLDVRCSGTIISEKFVLTAGHCSGTPDNAVVYVVVGALRLQELRDVDKRYKVKSFIVHPTYKSPIQYHDLALVELESPIQLSRFVVPACLDVGGPVNDSYVLAVSWGISLFNNFIAQEKLQKVLLKKYPTQECADMNPPTSQLDHGFDPLIQTCYAPNTPEQDTCQGDSGSAILTKSKTVRCMYTVIGVTSYGPLCGDIDGPALYTRIATYVPWIESIVWR